MQETTGRDFCCALGDTDDRLELAAPFLRSVSDARLAKHAAQYASDVSSHVQDLIDRFPPIEQCADDWRETLREWAREARDAEIASAPAPRYGVYGRVTFGGGTAAVAPTSNDPTDQQRPQQPEPKKQKRVYVAGLAQCIDLVCRAGITVHAATRQLDGTKNCLLIWCSASPSGARAPPSGSDAETPLWLFQIVHSFHVTTHGSTDENPNVTFDKVDDDDGSDDAPQMHGDSASESGTATDGETDYFYIVGISARVNRIIDSKTHSAIAFNSYLAVLLDGFSRRIGNNYSVLRDTVAAPEAAVGLFRSLIDSRALAWTAFSDRRYASLRLLPRALEERGWTVCCNTRYLDGRWTWDATYCDENRTRHMTLQRPGSLGLQVRWMCGRLLVGCTFSDVPRPVPRCAPLFFRDVDFGEGTFFAAAAMPQSAFYVDPTVSSRVDGIGGEVIDRDTWRWLVDRGFIAPTVATARCADWSRKKAPARLIAGPLCADYDVEKHVAQMVAAIESFLAVDVDETYGAFDATLNAHLNGPFCFAATRAFGKRLHTYYRRHGSIKSRLDEYQLQITEDLVDPTGRLVTNMSISCDLSKLLQEASPYRYTVDAPGVRWEAFIVGEADGRAWASAVVYAARVDKFGRTHAQKNAGERTDSMDANYAFLSHMQAFPRIAIETNGGGDRGDTHPVIRHNIECLDGTSGSLLSVLEIEHTAGATLVPVLEWVFGRLRDVLDATDRHAASLVSPLSYAQTYGA